MKRTEIKERLIDQYHFSDITFTRDGAITVKQSYFYRPQAGTYDQMKQKIRKAFEGIEIEFLDHGDHFRPFKGGSKAGSEQASWIYVKFKFKEKSSD